MVRARATYLSKNWKRAMTENAQKIEHTTNPTHMTHMRKISMCEKTMPDFSHKRNHVVLQNAQSGYA